MAVAEPTPDPGIARLRRRLLIAAAGALIGIGWSVAVDSTMGGVIVVGSFVVLVASVHRFGRTGPG